MMARRILIGIPLFFMLISCGAEPPAKRTIRADELNIDGYQRLPENVTPVEYNLDLTIDPTKKTFSGSVSIRVDIKQRTQVIYLHAEALTIKRVVVESHAAKTPVAIGAKTAIGSNGGIALILEDEVVAGSATIVMEYEAKLGEVPMGLYRVEEASAWYAFTQFEPLEARKAFPSFDEPKFKTPFTTRLTVPTKFLAASNTPEIGKDTKGELTTYSFKKSPPLPTYLIAFAVGEFDVVEAPADAIPGVPFRILATKGNGHLSEFMMKRTPALVKVLIDYFGGEFPYEKLDFVAVPNFSSGAMENVGLVTYRERFLLLDPQAASVQDRRSSMSITLHEVAHMWFGNLVTMAWWDDLWLNESFATWMQRQILAQVAPTLETAISDVSSTQWVLESDGLENARQIRQPIKTGGDVYNAFDGITYQKGAAVLEMVKQWIGEEAMQVGIRAYLKQHEHGSGDTASFLAAMDEASRKPVSAVFQTFLSQPGAPLVSAELTCEDTPKVKITQSRYYSGGKETGGASWKFPICIRYEVKGKSEVHCDLLMSPEKTIELPTKKCPKWIHPNADARGYFRWILPEEALEKLSTKYRGQLSVQERLDLWGNLRALTKARKIPAETFLKGMDGFMSESSPFMVKSVIYALEDMDQYVPAESRKKWQKKVSKLTRKPARKLGFERKKREQPSLSMVRANVLWANAYLAEDAQTVKKGSEIADTYFSNMDANISTDILRVALAVAAWEGDAALWLKYKMALGSAKPGARRTVIGGLGSFRDPDLQRSSLKLFLDGTLRAQDFWSLIGPSLGRPETLAITWEWLTTNYAKIVEVLGPKSAGSLPWVGGSFCDEASKKKVEEFFSHPDHRAVGSDRNLAQSLESIDICIRQNQYLGNALRERL